MSVEENTEELETEINQEQDDAAFEAGFAEAHGDEPPASEQAADEGEPSGGEPAQDEQEEEEVMFAGLKESEIKSLFAKAAKYDELEGRVFGKFGEVQRTIQQMQQQGSGGQRMKITVDKLKRLSEFDPEFAEAIAEDLSDILTGGTNAPGETQIDPAQVEQAFEQRVSQATSELAQQFEAKLLTMKHPDWQQTAASEDFQVWKSTLDPQDQQTLTSTWDATFIANKLDEFKAWKGRSNKQQSNRRRLEQAVTPSGTGRAAGGGNDDDAFLAGFNSMRGT